MTDQDRQDIRNSIRVAVAHLSDAQAVSTPALYAELQDVIYSLMDIMEEV